MSDGPYTPASHLPWLRWLDQTELPAPVIAFIFFLLYIPFYDFRGISPQLPLEGGAFPPACALTLMFFLLLTRGAFNDLSQLIKLDKINVHHITAIAPSKRAAWIELAFGIGIGLERVYSQLKFASKGDPSVSQLMDPVATVIALTIVIYTVLQIHLLMFCLRQAMVFRRVAKDYRVDLLTPELNSSIANPLIRFFALGFVGISFGVLIFELVPYASLQRRVLEATFFAGFIWFLLLTLSTTPLFIMKSRISLAKKMEINLIRTVLRGETTNVNDSQFGERLATFSPADLMYYEDRINAIWEWPFEAQIRRFIFFGLLPPLTWVLAALVEIFFETFLVG